VVRCRAVPPHVMCIPVVVDNCQCRMVSLVPSSKHHAMHVVHTSSHVCSEQCKCKSVYPGRERVYALGHSDAHTCVHVCVSVRLCQYESTCFLSCRTEIFIDSRARARASSAHARQVTTSRSRRHTTSRSRDVVKPLCASWGFLHLLPYECILKC
jgi:hypothetical protein